MNVQNLAAALRGGLIQQGRLLKLDTPLGPNSLVVQRAIGHSTVGRDYIFTLDVVSTDSAIELKRLIAQPVTLWIQQASGDYRPINGYVYTARRLGADGGLTTYQITLQAWMHILKFRRDQRIWIDKTVEDIVSDVLKQHPEARGRFRFTLSQSLPNRSYTRQSETDWNFVHRLLESEGLFGYWEQADDGKSHTLVITDRPDTFPDLSPKSISFYRGGAKTEVDAFTQWAGTRTLQSVTLTTRTFDYKNPSDPSNPKGTTVPTIESQGNVPDQLEVYEYTGAYTYLQQQRGDAQSRFRMEEWESRAKRFHGIGGLRAIEAGRRFVLTDHPVHDTDPVDQREFATIKSSWWIENNLPITLESNFPYSLHDDIADARASHPGDASLQVPHADGSVGFYLVEVEAQRASVPYRSLFEHEKPKMHLETAVVVGPSGEEVYTDELNRIRVHFVWDRVNEGDESASCWVRVVQSDTGGGYGGVHVPRIGEEVLIDHVGGDCDRPLVVGRVYNGVTQPQWHSNGLLSGYRSKEYAGSGFNELALDDATSQNRVRLMSSSSNSILHLGYLIDQEGNTRGAYLGSGFDLRTDAYGAVRATRGLYVTTHPKSPTSQPLDVCETQQQLVNAESLLESLSGISELHQAESLKPGRDAMRAFTDATQDSVSGATSGGRTAGGGTGSASAFKESVMLFGSPASIGLSTHQSVHVSADQHVNLVSGQSTHIAIGKSLLASVGQKLSLFVQNAGIKLFAGKGKVEIQAQSDNIEVTAQKAVKVVSATDRIEIAADQGILLTSGGAYILIKDGNVEVHAPGKIDIKGASHTFAGPASTNFVMPHLPQGVAAPTDLEFRLVDPYGRPSPGVEYKTTLSDGSVKHGVLDADGYAKISGVPAGTSAKVQYLTDKSPPKSEVGIKTDSDWSLFQSIKVTAKPVADAGNSNDPDRSGTV
ncbi:type VI secretion system tip protein VgrG [Burkholderia cenocepacia]|nr:type VI secretion system tip protein VgrG [Burkholderia cenocepacia]RQZ89058.1 type VI secretion system tip protein VgrG [Burkholderia cenocepacia]RRA09230.1 type VI secretion system tip protein VgrG [Burkholderia cenocepacia]